MEPDDFYWGQKKTQQQAIIYESGQADLKSNTQVVLMCTRLVFNDRFTPTGWFSRVNEPSE